MPEWGSYSLLATRAVGSAAATSNIFTAGRPQRPHRIPSDHSVYDAASIRSQWPQRGHVIVTTASKEFEAGKTGSIVPPEL